MRLELRGTAVTAKSSPLSPLPAVLITVIGPVAAPTGTSARIWLSESTVKLLAGVILKTTPVTAMNSLPLMVTSVPTGPSLGVNEVI